MKKITQKNKRKNAACIKKDAKRDEKAKRKLKRYIQCQIFETARHKNPVRRKANAN